MKTTIESTAATDIAVKMHMPPDDAATVLAYFGRLQARRAAQQPDPAHARGIRTQELTNIVLGALKNATLRAAVLAVHPRFRTSIVRRYLIKNQARDGIWRVPSKEMVRRVLRQYDY